jgi:hypothetical protein
LRPLRGARIMINFWKRYLGRIKHSGIKKLPKTCTGKRVFRLSSISHLKCLPFVVCEMGFHIRCTLCSCARFSPLSLEVNSPLNSAAPTHRRETLAMLSFSLSLTPSSHQHLRGAAALLRGIPVGDGTRAAPAAAGHRVVVAAHPRQLQLRLQPLHPRLELGLAVSFHHFIS